MNIVVMNFSGNVGKSTISRHLLAPRLNAVVIPIESINSDGTDDATLRGKQFAALMDEMATNDHSVIDVGASNVEDFMHSMTQYRGSHEDIDFFVIPTVSDVKQQRDTISTIDHLTDMGVPAHKIKMVFNMVEPKDEHRTVFAGLYEYSRDSKKFAIDPNANIYKNELFDKISGSEMTIANILNDITDFKTLMKSTADPQEKLKLSRALGIKRLAAGVNDELDQVFSRLF